MRARRRASLDGATTERSCDVRSRKNVNRPAARGSLAVTNARGVPRGLECVLRHSGRVDALGVSAERAAAALSGREAEDARELRRVRAVEVRVPLVVAACSGSPGPEAVRRAFRLRCVVWAAGSDDLVAIVVTGSDDARARFFGYRACDGLQVRDSAALRDRLTLGVALNGRRARAVEISVRFRIARGR